MSYSKNRDGSTAPSQPSTPDRAASFIPAPSAQPFRDRARATPQRRDDPGLGDQTRRAEAASDARVRAGPVDDPLPRRRRRVGVHQTQDVAPRDLPQARSFEAAP